MTTLKPEDIQALSLETLRRRCDAAQFSFAVTDELPHQTRIIGQQRAVEAIHFGLDIESPGFNLFVFGPTGSGRRSTVRRIVSDRASQAETPPDWVYVNHFSDPGTPRAISLPPGKGAEFRADMERFSNGLAERLTQAFETDEYAAAREQLEQRWRSAQQAELSGVDLACRERGFALLNTPSGIYIAAVQEGEVLSPEAYSQLAPEERARLDQERAELEDMLNGALRRLREHERRTSAAVEQLDQEVADFTVRPLLDELKEKYEDQPEVQVYLDEVREDIVQHVGLFPVGSDREEQSDGGGSLLDVPLQDRYHVNLLVDHRETSGAPMVELETLTYGKLFGRIEYDVRYGTTTTDYTLIRPGALHEANGGYLILDAEALLNDPYAWPGLKRALFHRTLRVESPDGQQLVRTVTPAPEPIPLQVKVILQGDAGIYYLLHDRDNDFAKLFKVQANFRSEMKRTPENELTYAQFIRSLTSEEGLLPFQAEAVARVVEFGSRLAGYQARLSTLFGQIADLVREASYWARQAGEAHVRRADVLTALRKRRRRENLSEELDRQDILEEQRVIATEGTAIGQVNGLSVVTLGGYEYGLPNRITARVYVGRGNVLDIQREVHLSGPIHGKGVLTLVGYFGGQYGARHSLAMEASLSFEQLYSDIDGDSASSAELYALISAIGKLPLRQDLAVTGAVDQFGRILSIGSVNEKIEGFFAICQARGLTGTQGVMIPASNQAHLMLCEEVIEAVRAGQFHIYPIATVDEGLALLTDLEVASLGDDGEFPEDSVHALVADQLREFAKYSCGDDEEESFEDETLSGETTASPPFQGCDA